MITKTCLTSLKLFCNAEDRLIVFVSPVRFNALWQRHQSLAVELAQAGFKVLYINPLKKGLFKVDYTLKKDSIVVVDLYVPLKASKFPGLQQITSKLAFWLLRKELSLLSAKMLLWIAEPSLAYLTKLFKCPVIYDKCDLHGYFPGQKLWVWFKYEKMILSKADLCFASNQFIANTLPENVRSVLLPNAAGSDFISSCNYIKQKGLKFNYLDGKLHLVSSGAHCEWVDFAWLNSLLQRKNIILHIAGFGRGCLFDSLIKRPEVVFHGSLDRNGLADLLTSCDVGLVPFKNIDLIKGVDPVKVYEYAAAGLEIWAPYSLYMSHNVFIDGFIDSSNPFLLVKNKYKTAKDIPSWKERLLLVMDEICCLFGKKVN